MTEPKPSPAWQGLRPTGWLLEEFARAAQRRALLPSFARPARVKPQPSYMPAQPHIPESGTES